MKLPRYSSTALPREQHLDPALAAAAAAAPGQFASQALSVVGDFAMKMLTAEEQSKAREADADNRIKLAEFESDPRWEQDEVEGRPTEQVMLEEYETLEKEMEAVGEGLVIKSIQSELQSSIKLRSADTRLRMQDAGNKIRIRRTKARDALTIDKLQRAGDWETVSTTITAGYESGIYTMAERDGMLEQNRKLERITPYIDALGSGDESEMDAKALEALTDKTLDADERVSMWRTLSSAADGEEADYHRERSERWSNNAVGMWRDYGALSVSDIEGMDISPEMKMTAIKQKRTDALSGKVYDNPAAVALGEELILSLYSDSNANVDNISKILGGMVTTGDLSSGTGLELQKKLMSISEDVFKGSNFSDVMRTAELEITKGIPTEDIFDFWGDNAALVGTIQSDWRSEMMRAKIDEGASFNPREYYEANIQRFRDRVDEIMPNTITDKAIRSKMIGLEGNALQIAASDLIIDIDNMDLEQEEKAKLYQLVRGYIQ